MTETLLSPGVLTRENDQSQIVQGPQIAGAAIVGPTVKGPVNIPTLVTSYSDYLNKFGGTFESGSTINEYLTSISAYNYFQQGGSGLLVTRVVSGTFSNATSPVYGNNSSVPTIYATASFNFSSFTNAETGSGVAIAFVDQNDNYIHLAAAAFGYDYTSYSNTLDYGYFSPSSGSGYNKTQWVDSLVNFINNDVTELNMSASVSGSVFNITSFNPLYDGAKIYSSTYIGSPTGSLTPISTIGNTTIGQSNVSFIIETISEGAIMNSSGSEGTNGMLASGSADNLRWEIVSPNISTGTFSLLVRRGNDTLNSKTILESWSNLSLDPNANNYIESVIGNQKSTITDSYIQIQGEYKNKSRYIRIKEVLTPTLNYFDNNGVAKPTYASSLPAASSGSFAGATGLLTSVYGTPNSSYTTSLSLLSNKDEFQFDVLTVPGATQKSNSPVTALAIQTCIDRGDSIAVIDVTDKGDNIATAVSEASEIDSSYAATYYPWVQVNSPQTGKLTWVPPSTIIPSVYEYNDRAGATWFAPAGFRRGGVPGVVQTERKLSPTDRDSLQLGRVNPIATFPGQGIVVYGQKTLQSKASALDRINVRRLLIELKRTIGQIGNTMVFENNTSATRNSFLAKVRPYLDSIQQRDGLYSYRVVMDDTNNTSDVIDRNQLVGQIFIQPTKSVEYVILDFNVTPTSATI